MPVFLRLQSNKHVTKVIFSTYLIRRCKTSLGLWQHDLNTDIKIKIERYWGTEVKDALNKNESIGKNHYVLPMFPYPSGNLHMGHVRVYSISDTIARFLALTGKNVIHPIGWDAFGLPAENAAIERNILPYDWTMSNIESMKNQLLKLGFNFDWTKEISTCDPQYYRWTQYIFLKLFERGLAYQNKGKVNWDPVDKTVLADEQVDEFGCSWRSGAKVESRVLTQWYIKTTKYAKQLYDGLKSENLENWNDIINLQQHWIGECDGVVVTFKLKVQDKEKNVDVWTAQPHKFIHAQFLVLSKNYFFMEDMKEIDLLTLKCYNPITSSELPVYITDDVNFPVGKDVYIASPESDEYDMKLAKALNLPIITKNKNPIDIEGDNKRAVSIAQNKNVGGYFVNSKLKDWLISRQRYWGTPIPIIHCPSCGTVPVPYDELPVKLPINSGSGIQTLEKIDNWVKCKCPKCQQHAKRETDTMDTFVDSSWYFYRFLDPKNKLLPFHKSNLIRKAPVDIYIGGKEHAVLHLYYARFMSYFLYSLGWTPTEEPFKKLIVQGMVMGQSYKVKSSGKYLPPENVEKVGKQFKEKATGEPVVAQWEKMSKSKHNGENPERLLFAYGCDATRLLILADVPPATSRHWSDATVPGIINWQHRLWLTIREFLKHRNDTSINKTLTAEEFAKYESDLWESRNYFIATTTYHFKHTHKLSVGISRLQSLTNTLRNKLPPEIINKSREFEIALANLIIMLSPVAPHFCSELWAGFLEAPNRKCQSMDDIIKWDKNVLQQKWPEVDDDYKLSFLCKVDGADRCDLKIKAVDLKNMSQEKALQLAVKEESVINRLKSGIHRVQYELYPGCRAILKIFSNRNVIKPKLEENNVRTVETKVN